MDIDIMEDAYNFILCQDLKTRQEIKNSIQLLKEYGCLIRMPYSKYLDDGIYELRVNGNNIIVRLLYFFLPDNKAVITNGFIKKMQKTPRKEILLAKERRLLYGRIKNKNIWRTKRGSS